MSGFLETDIRCFEALGSAELLRYRGRNDLGYLLASWRAAGRCDAVYIFFASEHGFLPALCFLARRRGVVLVPAGYDYANVPERRYGLAARRMGWLPKLLGRMASVALPISRQSLWEFLAMVPSAAPKTRLAYLAVEPERWEDPGVQRDPDLAVTVGFVDEEAWSRKGVDRFVAAAASDPERRYVLAGRVSDGVAKRLSSARPSNLQVTGALSHDELRRLLWSAGVYVQLSWHETFGVAMAEAMLCGCVPAISPSMALGEVAGRWAVVATGDHPDAAIIARAATRGREEDRELIRRDISSRFSPAARRQTLGEAVAAAVRA